MADSTMQAGGEPAKLHPSSGTSTTRSSYAIHSELTTFNRFDAFDFNADYQKIHGESWRRHDDPARIQRERRKNGSSEHYWNPDRKRDERVSYYQGRRQEPSQNPDKRRDKRVSHYQGRRQERSLNPDRRRDERERFDDESKRVEQVPKKRSEKKLTLLKSAPRVEIEQASDDEILIACSMVVTPKHIKIETEEERAQRLKEEAELAKNLAEKQHAEQLRIYYRQQREELERQKQLDEEQKLIQKEESIQHKEAKKEARRLKKQMEYKSLLEREAELSKANPSSSELQEIRKRIDEIETGFRMMKSLV